MDLLFNAGNAIGHVEEPCLLLKLNCVSEIVGMTDSERTFSGRGQMLLLWVCFFVVLPFFSF